ncbi:hypothetical protein D9756_006743 [Leucocoprinus leucothites]|uniref:Uncharacterized protein n=1 Tax=Leucocoprinus leucothites TaxID=201217 RepID=A0A8H5LGF0_9AGAR|nr:hypothetical protein D9756_006743 [Leucoagaricus leucothites]
MGFFTYAHHFPLDGYGQDYGPGKTDPTQVAKRVIEVAKSLQAIDRPALSSPDILQAPKSHSNTSRPGHLQGGLMYLSPEEKAELEAQLDQMHIKLEARKQQKLRDAKKAGLTNRGSRKAEWQDKWNSGENDGRATLVPSQPINPLSRVSPPSRGTAIPSPHGGLHLSSLPPQCPSSVFHCPPVETTPLLQLSLSDHRLLDQQPAPALPRPTSAGLNGPPPFMFLGQREDVESDGDCEDSAGRSTAEPQSLPVPNVSGTSRGCSLDDAPTTKVKRRRSPLLSLSKLISGGIKSRVHAVKNGT